MAADDRRLAIERLKIRAEMRSNPDEEEDTGVIELRAAERVKPISSVPPSKRGMVWAIVHGLVQVLTALPPWSRPIVVLALILALSGSGWSLASLTGIVK